MFEYLVTAKIVQDALYPLSILVLSILKLLGVSLYHVSRIETIYTMQSKISSNNCLRLTADKPAGFVWGWFFVGEIRAEEARILTTASTYKWLTSSTAPSTEGDIITRSEERR